MSAGKHVLQKIGRHLTGFSESGILPVTDSYFLPGYIIAVVTLCNQDSVLVFMPCEEGEYDFMLFRWR